MTPEKVKVQDNDDEQSPLGNEDSANGGSEEPSPAEQAGVKTSFASVGGEKHSGSK